MTSPAPSLERTPLRHARRIVAGALAVGFLFEVANLIGTQDKTIFAVTPWQDDPYHAVLLAALFTVAMLSAALGARMLVWSAAGAGDRARQMLRGAGVLVGVITIAAGFQWAAVASGRHARTWDTATALQIAGSSVVTVAAVAVAVALVTARTAGPAQWSTDWLGDAALLVARVPWVDGAAVIADGVAWIRPRAIRVFAGVSVVVALPIVAAQALGEQWTDPVLIVWALIVLTATIFTFCVIANALAGIVSRPPRSRARRNAEWSLVGGCLAIQVSEAFHDQIWQALTGHPAGTVAALLALTAGSGLIGAAACAAVTALSGGSDGAR